MNHNKQVYIIHIGKCGGSSLRSTLKLQTAINFKYCHYDNPEISLKYKYIILIRDPINRIISAFNWVLNHYGNNGVQKHESKDLEGIYWDNVNDFAENIYNEMGELNEKAFALINEEYASHLHADINYYLKDLLEILSLDNCKIIRFENYFRDAKDILDIYIKINLNNYKRPYIYLSKKRIRKFKKILL